MACLCLRNQWHALQKKIEVEKEQLGSTKTKISVAARQTERTNVEVLPLDVPGTTVTSAKCKGVTSKVPRKHICRTVRRHRHGLPHSDQIRAATHLARWVMAAIELAAVFVSDGHARRVDLKAHKGDLTAV